MASPRARFLLLGLALVAACKRSDPPSALDAGASLSPPPSASAAPAPPAIPDAGGDAALSESDLFPHAVRDAPETVRRWLGVLPPGETKPHPYSEYFSIDLPPGAQLTPAAKGFDGFWILDAAGGRSSMKLRRTATQYDPKTVFDRYPPCPSMETAREQARRSRIVLDTEWKTPLILGSCEARVALIVFDGQGGTGYYAHLRFNDFVDRASQESVTIACCAAGLPEEMAGLRGRLDEASARAHVAACLSLSTRVC
jgi:hypothetical protein